MRNLNYAALLTTAAAVATSCAAEESTPPNIIYILADDLGYGDLGCYGQEYIETPNIDRMAEMGLLFTQHYTGNAVSAPSRSTLMTGLHTGHCPIRSNSRNKGVVVEDDSHDVAAKSSIARMLNSAGYATGSFGKWGLSGVSSPYSPLNVGFDEFYGFVNQTLAHNHYPYSLIDGDKKVMLEGNTETQREDYAPDLIHERAIKFIEANRDQPFFAYLAYTLPHAELLVPEDEIVEKYRAKLPPGERYEGAQPSDKGYQAGAYCSVEEPRSVYAAMVSRLDKYVGEVYAKLEELGIADNTIVIFSSDNGPSSEGGNDTAFFNSSGPLRGQKRDVFEGGIRAPMLVTWPAKIKSSRVVDHVSAFWDIMPTIADCAGVESFSGIDGVSFYPTLIGKGTQPQHEYLYWEFHSQGGKIAIRYGDWKGIKLMYGTNPDAPMLLYNLTTDIGEEHDVAAENPEIVEKIENFIKGARSESPYYTFLK